jgi:hypothetical protein
MTIRAGIELDAYVVVQRDSSMTYAVCPTEVRIELSHGTGTLHLTAGEGGLARLVEVVGAALRDIRAVRGL